MYGEQIIPQPVGAGVQSVNAGVADAVEGQRKDDAQGHDGDASGGQYIPDTPISLLRMAVVGCDGNSHNKILFLSFAVNISHYHSRR